MWRAGVGGAADEFTQCRHGVAGQVGLRVVEPHAFPYRVPQLWQLAGWEAARRSISDVGQGERARPVRCQRLLDCLDHIVAAVFARQHQVVTQHRAGACVDDHQQPDALDFEFLFEAKRVADHYLQAHIEPVSVEFDHLVWTNGAAAGGAGHTLETRGAGGARRVTEVGEYFRRHVGRQ